MNFLSLLGMLPNFVGLVAFAKSLPTLLDDLSGAVGVIEKTLVDAAAAANGAVNIAAAKAALEKVKTILAQAKAGLAGLGIS